MSSLKESTRLALRIVSSDAPQLIIDRIDSPELVVCCFCLEEIFPLQGCVIRPCEHVFHALCFLKDFYHNKISRCPECRCEYLYNPFSSETSPQPMEGIEDTGSSLSNNATTETLTSVDLVIPSGSPPHTSSPSV